MPELPEVEVLVRHLSPVLNGRRIVSLTVHRPKVLAPTTPTALKRSLLGASFKTVTRRGKYLLFLLEPESGSGPLSLVGHLGMTGRMFVQPETIPLPKHCAVALRLDRGTFVFEDTRYFGRLTLDRAPLARLGPEPLGDDFSASVLAKSLASSRQPIKIKLLDQSLVAGIGNIYASEALHRAGVSPGLPARSLRPRQVSALWRAIRAVLRQAIACGSTVPLNFGASAAGDGLFYFGTAAGSANFYEERLRVYDRAGRPCRHCGEAIVRLVQAARSTYYCPRCQPSKSRN